MSCIKYGIAGLALVASIAIVAPAGAGLPSVELENKYEGKVERDDHTYFGFDAVRREGRRFAANLTAHLPFACDNGSDFRDSIRMSGRLRIKDRRFGGALTGAASRGGIQIRMLVTGRLRKEGRARGSIQAELRSTERARGLAAGVRCYTGSLLWRARRGADHELPF